MDVGIDLLPLGLVFHPGEQLRLVVSSRSLLGTMMPGNREYATPYDGRHIVHTGGDQASYSSCRSGPRDRQPAGQGALARIGQGPAAFPERSGGGGAGGRHCPAALGVRELP